MSVPGAEVDAFMQEAITLLNATTWGKRGRSLAPPVGAKSQQSDASWTVTITSEEANPPALTVQIAGNDLVITGPVSLAFPEDIDYPAGNTPDGWVFVPDPNQSPDAVQITGHFRTSLALPKHSDSGFATASAPKAEIVVKGIKSLPVQHVHGGPRTEN